jgi:hypothetical protein
MSARLKSFTFDQLHALVFRLDIAETIEPLGEFAEGCDKNGRLFQSRRRQSKQPLPLNVSSMFVSMQGLKYLYNGASFENHSILYYLSGLMRTWKFETSNPIENDWLGIAFSGKLRRRSIRANAKHL